MKNVLLTLTITFFAFGIIAWLARPGSGPSDGGGSAGESILIASSSFHDFGDVSMAAGDVSFVYTISNDGTEPVTIGKVFSSCMCTSAVLSLAGREYGPYGMQGHGFIPRVNKPLAPGETAQLKVTFDPAAHGPAGVGQISRTVTIEQDDSAPLVVSFEANVTP